jgi:hypothetical protein
MVTCADSQVRIIEGLNVVGKFKGILFRSHFIRFWFNAIYRYI